MAESDIDLLQQFQRTRADAPFARLVERHIDVVFSAALRQLGSRELAQDVTQAVFLDLARNAAKLRPDSVIPAWLYQVTRRKCVDLIRSETRRRAREEASAAAAAPIMNAPDPLWREVEPLLDEALGELSEPDRAALILRFVQNNSLRDVGVALGVSEDTAQKRVSRALDKVRELLSAKGAVASPSALGAAISACAVQSAPAGLAAAVTGSAAGAAATFTSIAIMTTLQKSVALTFCAAAVGVPIWQQARIAKLSSQVASMRSQIPIASPGPASVEALAGERELLSARVAALEKENEQLRGASSELLRLRAEVTRLSQNQRDRAPADAFVQSAVDWKEKEGKLRRLIEAQPSHRVPEIDLLKDRVWLDIARDADLETEAGVRRAFSELRRIAKNILVPDLSEALRRYVNEHDGQLPAALADLKPYLSLPVTDAMLDQYRLAYAGRLADVPRGEYVLSEKVVVDPENDRLWKIGPGGYRSDNPRQDQLLASLQEMLRLYRAANGGQAPKDLKELMPFAKSPDQHAALDEFGSTLIGR